MSEIYWLTRLDAVENVFAWCLVVGIVATIGFSIAFFVNRYLFIEEDDECGEKWMIYCRKNLQRWTIPLIVVGALGLTFVPNTKQAFLIYGVGGGIDYLKENPTAQKLPDKVIEALDGWVEELNPKNKKSNE